MVTLAAVIAEVRTRDIDLATLTAKHRDTLPDSAFAVPSQRKYPIQDERHARLALAFVAMHGSPAERAMVRAAVARKYPDIGANGKDANLSVQAGASDIDLVGKAGSTWRHNYIPTNPTAVAMKLHHFKGGSSTMDKYHGKQHFGMPHDVAVAVSAGRSAGAAARAKRAAEAAAPPVSSSGSSELAAKAARARELLAERKKLKRQILAGRKDQATTELRKREAARPAEPNKSVGGTPVTQVAPSPASTAHDAAVERAKAKLARRAASWDHVAESLKDMKARLAQQQVDAHKREAERLAANKVGNLGGQSGTGHQPTRKAKVGDVALIKHDDGSFRFAPYDASRKTKEPTVLNMDHGKEHVLTHFQPDTHDLEGLNSGQTFHSLDEAMAHAKANPVDATKARAVHIPAGLTVKNTGHGWVVQHEASGKATGAGAFSTKADAENYATALATSGIDFRKGADEISQELKHFGAKANDLHGGGDPLVQRMQNARFGNHFGPVQVRHLEGKQLSPKAEEKKLSRADKVQAVRDELASRADRAEALDPEAGTTGYKQIRVPADGQAVSFTYKGQQLNGHVVTEPQKDRMFVVATDADGKRKTFYIPLSRKRATDPVARVDVREVRVLDGKKIKALAEQGAFTKNRNLKTPTGETIRSQPSLYELLQAS